MSAEKDSAKAQAREFAKHAPPLGVTCCRCRAKARCLVAPGALPGEADGKPKHPLCPDCFAQWSVGELRL